MSKIKIVEIVILAISAFIAAAKSIIKFIDYIGKLKARPAISAI